MFTLCHICSLYVTYVHHMSSHIKISSAYVTYVHHMSSLDKICLTYVTHVQYLWFTKDHPSALCSLCITYIHHVTCQSYIFTICHMCFHMFIICHISSLDARSGWHIRHISPMFIKCQSFSLTLCHPCQLYVASGWGILTICHIYLLYVISGWLLKLKIRALSYNSSFKA